MTDIKIGDRVRVTFEGVVAQNTLNGWYVKVNDDLVRYVFLDPGIDTIEVISPPLQVGDRVKPNNFTSEIQAVIVAIVDEKAWVKWNNGADTVWPLADLLKVES